MAQGLECALLALWEIARGALQEALQGQASAPPCAESPCAESPCAESPSKPITSPPAVLAFRVSEFQTSGWRLTFQALLQVLGLAFCGHG